MTPTSQAKALGGSTNLVSTETSAAHPHHRFALASTAAEAVEADTDAAPKRTVIQISSSEEDEISEHSDDALEIPMDDSAPVRVVPRNNGE